MEDGKQKVVHEFRIYQSRATSKPKIYVYTLSEPNQAFGDGFAFGRVEYRELIRLSEIAQKLGYQVLPVGDADGTGKLPLEKGHITRIKKRLSL